LQLGSDLLKLLNTDKHDLVHKIALDSVGPVRSMLNASHPNFSVSSKDLRHRLTAPTLPPVIGRTENKCAADLRRLSSVGQYVSPFRCLSAKEDSAACDALNRVGYRGTSFVAVEITSD
jgi:hypothetical protein